MNLTNKLVQILQDDEVQRLSLLLRRFNPFEVLKIGHYELRHTNTLAWLLDPAGNHGLGDTFLRAFIARLDTTDPTDALTQRFETADDRTVTIRREVRLSHLRRDADEGERLGLVDEDELAQGPVGARINSTDAENTKKEGAVDILVDGDGWVLAIEAKVRAGEGEGQLKSYKEALKAYVGSKKKLISIFLTIDGDKPSEDDWISANWQENVINPLEKVLLIHHELREDIRFFLTSYLSTVKRYAGGGDELEELATTLATSERLKRPLQEIQQALGKKVEKNGLNEKTKGLLRRHAPTVRLLLARTTSIQVARAGIIEGCLKDKFERISGSANYISFVPIAWESKFPRMLSIRGGCIFFEITNRPSSLTIKLTIPSLGENFQDEMANNRRKLVKLIHDDSNNINTFPRAFYKNNQPRTLNGRYDTVYLETYSLTDQVTDDEIQNWTSDRLNHITTKILEKLEKLMENSGIK